MNKPCLTDVSTFPGVNLTKSLKEFVVIDQTSIKLFMVNSLTQPGLS
jgi:hypothetical protein